MANVEELRARYNIEVNEADVVDPEGTGLTLGEKARLIAQGATFNFSDEIAALFRTLAGQNFEEALSEERTVLEAAREKEGSLKYELGGAVASSVAAAPFTGGASIPATAGRLAAIGSVQGLTSAIGEREGDVSERLTENPLGLAGATTAGAIAGPAGSKVTELGGKVISGILSPAKRAERALSGRLAKPVEDEVLRIANESGFTADEIIEKIGKGEVIADMSEQATNAVRALYAKSGEGGQIIADTLVRRADELPLDARSTLQADLAPRFSEGNVTKYFDQSIDEIKAGESAAYNKIFGEAAGVKSNSLNLAVQEVLQNQRFLRNKVNALLEAKNKPPLFEVKDKKVILLDDVDLETAEIVRRALNDKATASFRSGEGSLGAAVGDLELGLRKVIDEASPDLARTRASWARIMASKNAFEDGKRIFGKTADDAEIFFEDLVAKGNADVIEAFRAGAASSLRSKATTGAQVTMFRNLSDLNRKERAILEKIYPGESIDSAFEKLQLAAKSIATRNKVLGGSPTAITEAGIKRIGATQGLADLSSLLGGDLMAGVRLAKGFLGNRSESLSQEQLTEIARIVVSEDQELVRRALTDSAARVALGNKVNQLFNLTVRGVGGATAIESGEAIDALIQNMSPSAKEQVINAGQ